MLVDNDNFHNLLTFLSLFPLSDKNKFHCPGSSKVCFTLVLEVFLYFSLYERTTKW